MPTITIDPLMVIYRERADLDYSWDEEGTNLHGFTSHETRPGYGAQYDPGREAQFAAYGWRGFVGQRFTLRRIWNFESEGPHETGGVLVFQPPVGRVTLTEAHLTLTPSSVDGTNPDPMRLYGAAVDDFVSRVVDASTGYPLGYRAEFHQATWGAHRRHRVDSVETEMPQTSEVTWSQTVQVDVAEDTANIASVLNEILARPGWKSGNRMALCVMSNTPPPLEWAGTVYAPNLGAMNYGAVYQGASFDAVTLTMTY